MIEKQKRDVWRDGSLFLIGFGGILIVEFILSGPVGTFGTAVHGFLFGCSVGISCSGIFHVTPKQTVYSTIVLGFGFALGAVINFF
ncbi:hypothetical protein EXE40_15775 [Halorubrum sp. GN11GM_10-3_MGM]|nr:hypothetical protein EXE40_15775 [Halorubrum sp. GN11GM_10-3_MGM]